MAKQKNKGKVTIANYIAILGLALLLVFTFIGHSYKSGGEMASDMLAAMGVTAAAALMLWFMIKAKGAENRLRQWRIVERGALVAYIVVIVPLSYFGGVAHFFGVTAGKARYKMLAQSDMARIDSMFATYERFENNAIVQTAAGLSAAVGMGQERGGELADFMLKERISANRMSVQNFEDRQRMMLLGEPYRIYRDECRRQRDEIMNVVEGWNMLQIPMRARQIEELAQSAAHWLTKRSAGAALPKVDYNTSLHRHNIIASNQTEVFGVEGGTGSLQFRKALAQSDGAGVGALLFLLLVHALILLNYAVAYRTRTLELNRNTVDDGGITL